MCQIQSKLVSPVYIMKKEKSSQRDAEKKKLDSIVTYF